MDGRRVAVTGVGVVGPCGIGREAFWEGLLAPAPDGERRKTDSRYSGGVQSEGRSGKAGTIFRRDPVTAFGKERRDEKILEGC